MCRTHSLAKMQRIASENKGYQGGVPLAIFEQLKGFSKQIEKSADKLKGALQLFQKKALKCTVISQKEDAPLIVELAMILSKMPPKSLKTLKHPFDLFMHAKDLGILYQACENPQTEALEGLSPDVANDLADEETNCPTQLPRLITNKTEGHTDIVVFGPGTGLITQPQFKVGAVLATLKNRFGDDERVLELIETCEDNYWLKAYFRSCVGLEEPVKPI